MDSNTEGVVDFINYVTHPQDVAIAILINNTLNFHVREDNILSYTHEPFEDKCRLTVELDETIRDNDFGETYTGKIRIIYDKLDASKVFPNGFYSNKVVGSSDFSISSILNLLCRNTRVIIREEEIDLEEVDGLTYLVFKESSLFWKGRIPIRSLDSIEYHDIDL